MLVTSVHAEKLTAREEKGGTTRGGMGRSWRGRAPELGVTQRVGETGELYFDLTLRHSVTKKETRPATGETVNTCGMITE